MQPLHLTLMRNKANVARALDILAEPSKKALLFHLTHTFKIPVDRKDCPLEEIEGH